MNGSQQSMNKSHPGHCVNGITCERQWQHKRTLRPTRQPKMEARSPIMAVTQPIIIKATQKHAQPLCAPHVSSTQRVLTPRQWQAGSMLGARCRQREDQREGRDVPGPVRGRDESGEELPADGEPVHDAVHDRGLRQGPARVHVHRLDRPRETEGASGSVATTRRETICASRRASVRVSVHDSTASPALNRS
eukprot:2930830-Rhodomonas_salina.1